MVFTQQAIAAIALDRTRVIFNGADKSVSLNVSNQNKDLPYLAQGPSSRPFAVVMLAPNGG